jgi:hypothetical protein
MCPTVDDGAPATNGVQANGCKYLKAAAKHNFH